MREQRSLLLLSDCPQRADLKPNYPGAGTVDYFNHATPKIFCAVSFGAEEPRYHQRTWRYLHNCLHN